MTSNHAEHVLKTLGGFMRQRSGLFVQISQPLVVVAVCLHRLEVIYSRGYKAVLGSLAAENRSFHLL